MSTLGDTCDRKHNRMFKGMLFTFFTALLFLAFVFCDNATQPEKNQYGTITGKVLYPDSNVIIRLLPEDGRIDTAALDPVSKSFVFDNVKTGMCILQVNAKGYGFHEQKFILNSRQLICKDIALAQTPTAVSYLFPSNSQNLDSAFFSVPHSAITDTGIQIIITFNDWMDSATLMNVLSIGPDSAGVKADLVQRISLIVFFPYWKLATIDTASITVGRGAIDRWKDTLDCDYMVFFPVDRDFIRTNRLTK